MDKRQLLELSKIDTTEISKTLYNKVNNTSHIEAVTVAYVLYEMQTEKISKVNSESINAVIASIENVEAKKVIKENISKISKGVFNCLGKFSSDSLLAFILFDNSIESTLGKESIATPPGILKLACQILDVKEDEAVTEFCSGKSNLLVELLTNASIKSYQGIEINHDISGIAHIRAAVLDGDYTISEDDVFNYTLDEKSDKLFSNYPFMLRLDNSSELAEKLSIRNDIPFPDIQKASTNWLFNLLLVENMKKDGKAVAIMNNGSAWNLNDIYIRKHFVGGGLVEAVISLPGRLFADTSIPVTLIVFSHNNSGVRFIDATNICTNERRNNVLKDADVKKIVDLLNKDSEVSVFKSISDIVKNDYTLIVERYLEQLPTFENAVRFGSVIKNIVRGSQMSASQLDKLNSSTPTNNKLLSLSNISDGIVDYSQNEQYLLDVSEKLEKYCAKNNSLVISKNGAPNFRSAVVKVGSDEKIVANGNLFVIELDESKVNPYFIQAFLSSDVGAKVLKSTYVGSSVPMVSMESLTKIEIPLPSLEEQEQIANKYIKAMEETITLKHKLKEATEKMSKVFENQ